jgi:hypothetical protein
VCVLTAFDHHCEMRAFYDRRRQDFSFAGGGFEMNSELPEQSTLAKLDPNIEAIRLAYSALLNGARSALMIDALRALSVEKARGRPELFPVTAVRERIVGLA